eukprot:TRINITY_DN4718_c0_g1_i1.p3 TRINITY_DN4718_c0_g1~~TRINITY_DN4718_c0_g1_i1.p3  ORF type:complete len:161 (-),score=28.54 TRINITY_DN4718_c0_g1_i1:351-833(-)
MKQFMSLSRKLNNPTKNASHLHTFKNVPTFHKPKTHNPVKIRCVQQDQNETQEIKDEEEEGENFFEGPGFNFWIPAAYLLFVTGSIDAGYSGDWSRIGAISNDTEEIMKVVSIGFGFLHIASVGAVFALGKQREKLNTVSNVFKGLLLGPLYVIEAFLAP